MNLERLAAELAAELRCQTCAGGGIDSPATHLAVYRRECPDGGWLTAGDKDVLLCAEHAAYLADALIPLNTVCRGCQRDVGGSRYVDHVVDRVVSLEAPQ